MTNVNALLGLADLKTEVRRQRLRALHVNARRRSLPESYNVRLGQMMICRRKSFHQKLLQSSGTALAAIALTSSTFTATCAGQDGFIRQPKLSKAKKDPTEPAKEKKVSEKPSEEAASKTGKVDESSVAKVKIEQVKAAPSTDNAEKATPTLKLTGSKSINDPKSTKNVVTPPRNTTPSVNNTEKANASASSTWKSEARNSTLGKPTQVSPEPTASKATGAPKSAASPQPASPSDQPKNLVQELSTPAKPSPTNGSSDRSVDAKVDQPSSRFSNVRATKQQTLRWITVGKVPATAERAGSNAATQNVTSGNPSSGAVQNTAELTFVAPSLKEDSSNAFSSSIPTMKSAGGTNQPNALSATGPTGPPVANLQMSGTQVDSQHLARAASANDVAKTERAKLASLVSQRIVSGQTMEPQQVMQPFDAAPGWNSVGQTLKKHIARCEKLLNRRAYLSAREEAESGMLYFVHVLDGIEHRYHCEPAWAAAQQALNEAEDFSSQRRATTDPDLIRRLIESHETPVLKTTIPDPQQMSLLDAAEAYRVYARACLIEAAQGHPWFSDVFYALGRTHQAQADSGELDALDHRNRAVTFYRAAMAVRSDNALAANQLGFILLQMDRPQDAKAPLLSSVRSRPSREGLKNLMEACRRLGDAPTYQWAAANLNAMGRAVPNTNAPNFVEVTPQAFVALSPRSLGPGVTAGQVGMQNAIAPIQSAPIQTASGGVRTATAIGPSGR